MVGLLIHVEGTVERRKFDGLPDLNQAVGGYIEGIPTPRADTVAYANEEGLIHGLPLNPRASRWLGQPIVGNVVVLGRRGGNEKDCPEGVEDEL